MSLIAVGRAVGNRIFIAVLLGLMIGSMIGWAGGNYWAERVRKIESMLALDRANAAAKKGALDEAIYYATQSYVLYPDSPVAGQMVKELTDSRAAKATGCPEQH